MDRAEQLIARGVSGLVIAKLLGTLVPQALGITIPMSLLVGLLIAFGRLSGDREIVALQACGVSLLRLFRPVAVMGLAAFAGTAWIMFEAMPWGNRTFQQITYDVVANRAEHEVKPRVFFEDFPGLVIYVRDLATDGSGWKDVFVADTRQEDKPAIYVAKKGRIALDRDQKRVEMLLGDTTQHRLGSSGPTSYEVAQIGGLRVTLDYASVFPQGTAIHSMNEMTVPELKAEVARLNAQKIPAHGAITALQRKWSIPTACLVFALLALGLGCSSRKDGKMASFALGVGVVFAYYVLMYIAEAMTKGVCSRGSLESCATTASWSPWLPNLVLGLAGLLLLVWKSGSVERRMRLAISVPWPQWRRDAAPIQSAPNRAPAARRRIVVVVRLPQLSFPGPGLLDRYVTQLYMKVFGLAFVGMMGIFYIATFLDLSDKLFKGQTTGATLLAYLFYATPQFVYYVLAISALIATLVTIGLLVRNSELVVMRACGISLYRTALPLLAMGLVWSGVLFGLEERVVAQANRRADAIRHEIRGGSPRTFDVLNRKWILGEAGSRVYHYVYFDPRQLELNGLSIYAMDEETWRMTARTYATRAVWKNGAWDGQQGWTREFSAKPDVTRYEAFERQALAIERPSWFVSEKPDADRMTYRQLKRYIGELQVSGFNAVPYAVALHRKLSFPLVTLIMTLLAVPFAVTTGRRGALYGVGIGLVIAISYWVLMSVFGAIGSGGMGAAGRAPGAPHKHIGEGGRGQQREAPPRGGAARGGPLTSSSRRGPATSGCRPGPEERGADARRTGSALAGPSLLVDFPVLPFLDDLDRAGRRAAVAVDSRRLELVAGLGLRLLHDLEVLQRAERLHELEHLRPLGSRRFLDLSPSLLGEIRKDLLHLRGLVESLLVFQVEVGRGLGLRRHDGREGGDRQERENGEGGQFAHA